jgi:hypothetical protein
MNAPATALREPLTFLPRVQVADAPAAYWLSQVTLRLRREVCWLWRERGMLAGASPADGAATLPPFTDRLSGVLDLMRYERDKRAFFAGDATARYLSDLLEQPAPECNEAHAGSFGWVAHELQLAPAECFTLALALTPVVDSAAGTVFAACLNDAARTAPTLALAQRLWDTPEALLALIDAGHALARCGLLHPAPADWDAPLATSATVARQLLFPAPERPATLRVVQPGELRAEGLQEATALLAARLRAAPPERLRLIPVLGQPGAPLAEAAAGVAAQTGQALLAPQPGARPADLPALMTVAWLRGAALYLPFDLLAGERADAHEHAALGVPLPGLPLTLLVGAADRAVLKRLPAGCALPALTLPPLDYPGRLALWRRWLRVEDDPALQEAVADCARRFRYEREAIETICAGLRALDRPLQPDDLTTACRADLDLGELAQPVQPRFALADLMLPARPARQVSELIHAMRNLTRVHYEWGTARAWSESGLSALFSGAPGTGKTMAAEVIAAEVGVPMFRIDLSQVVNKYIGETEKNLRRLFDAADATDVILFFDEADALFGKRTEVKDAHDRYANLEVSYLLERMERFKGLAILATNRRKDLDEAFLRRLRFAIEFPLPEAEERLRIWRQVIPAGVDAAGLDLPFLAQRFPLAGGHIRSIAFHACLQSAGRGTLQRLEMPAVLRAVRREYDKLNRAISLDQFGPYAPLIGDGS